LCLMQGQERLEITGENNPKYNREKVKCDYCGKVFERVPSFNKGEHLFCSSECRKKWEKEKRDYAKEKHPRWKGGHNEYMRKLHEALGDWEEEREKALERDRFRCQFCEVKENLHVHHIKPIRENGSNYIGNLITLCRGCHASIEASL